MGDLIDFNRYRGDMTVEQAQALIDGIPRDSLLGAVSELAQALDLYTLREKAESGQIEHRPLYRLVYDIRKARGEVETKPDYAAIMQGRKT